MGSNNVLFIVEGDSDEVKFLKTMIRNCYSSKSISFYSYKTTLHTLAQVLNDEYPDFEKDEIDLKLVLRSHEPNADRQLILSQHYRDVYLVFDFEPQHDNPHFEVIRRMLVYFNSSSDQGKLYINYPMMQSYKHMLPMPDHKFLERSVTLSDVMKYKRIVGQESSYQDLTRYDYIIFASLAAHVIMKINYILHHDTSLPDFQKYLEFSPVELFDYQIQLVNTHGLVSVLNTSILIFVDFAPEKYFREISTHRSDYYI